MTERGAMPQSQMSLEPHPILQIQLGNAKLEDFLSAGEFAETMFAARWRVIRLFADARSGPGKRSTPGYIVGLNGRLSSVASFIQRNMSEHAQEKVFSVGDLPLKYRIYSMKHREFIIRYVRYELFIRLLVIMREAGHLWYIGGEWSLPQSILDEYGLLFKEAKDNFRNDRSWHGRPRSHRARQRGLGIGPGISTGLL
jgi:hypothetical protein